ncbi:hypothetical protein EGL68_00560 [Vibrio parahaemolyticus]|nr:hypothetical protein EGL68_00560 [Vibrio parahaemolyticus]
MDPKYIALFKWLKVTGKLCISQKLLNEYTGTGNRNITILLSELIKNSENVRLIKYSNAQLKEFNIDRRYKYTANREDREHAKLVFLSPRKKLISRDNKLIADVNGFKKVDGIQPEAQKIPDPTFYE